MTEDIWAGLRPMLATPGTELPEGPQWSFEVKWDGIRALARVGADAVALRSRNGNDLAGRYPGLGEAGLALADLAGALILDGECVAFDASGRPSFPGAMRAGAAVAFVAFDLLAAPGRDLRTESLARRREALAALDLEARTEGRWRAPGSFPDGRALFEATREQGLEGVVAKRAASPYRAGTRSPDWLKFPHRSLTDVIVVGYVRPESGPDVAAASSLLIADTGGHFLGSVGSGLTGRMSTEVAASLDAAGRATPPPMLSFAEVPEEAMRRRFGDRLRWSEPVLVATVRHLGHTQGRILRQPTLERVRTDLGPEDLMAADPRVAPDPGPASIPHRDDPGRDDDGGNHAAPGSSHGAAPLAAQVAGRTLRLTNLDKVLYPATGTTKAQLIEYMTTVAEPLLAQLAFRPITRRRWPHGVADADFFEKAVPRGAPTWLGRVGLRRNVGSSSESPGSGTARDYRGYIDYPLLAGTEQDVAALVWFAQTGVLELHTPQWRVKRRAQFGVPGPVDRMVIDLDPGPPAGLPECCEVALVAREILTGAGFTTFPVASGSKGLHVYVPFPEPLPAPAVLELAGAVAAGLATAVPHLVVLKVAKTLREGRVYVDVAQNLPARTTITPYSPRGREQPTVATPLHWDEVASGRAAPATIHSMPDRLATLGDLMHRT